MIQAPLQKLVPLARTRQHLLIVDDEKPLRDVLGEYLAKRGYRITPVESAAQALAALNEDYFNLAIIDLVMPEVDGLELLTSIRAEHPGLPVLVLTGIGFDEEVLQEARAKGASGFLTKGLPLSSLLSDIHRILDYSSVA